METRANYAIIGAFTLAVIFAAFGFVFWFSGPSKTAARKGFDVIFTGSVAGLTKGGAVTFNGLRVGDVTHLNLDPDNPSQVISHIEIDKRMPVKQDTRARLEFSGLTGVASLALSGGSAASPPLEVSGNQSYPTIHADPSQFQNLLESAQRIGEKLGDLSDKANKLIDENREGINRTVTNIQSMTGSLADKYDGVGPLLLSLNHAATKLDNILGSVGPDAGKTIAEIGEAARSVHKLADDVDSRMKEIMANVARFTGAGLRQYEALAADGRRTLDDISRAVRSLEKNPSQIILGAKPTLPEYKAR